MRDLLFNSQIQYFNWCPCTKVVEKSRLGLLQLLFLWDWHRQHLVKESEKPLTLLTLFSLLEQTGQMEKETCLSDSLYLVKRAESVT